MLTCQSWKTNTNINVSYTSKPSAAGEIPSNINIYNLLLYQEKRTSANSEVALSWKTLPLITFTTAALSQPILSTRGWAKEDGKGSWENQKWIMNFSSLFFFLLCLGAKLLGALGVRLSQSSRHCNGCKSRQLVSVWTEADVDTRKPYSLEGGWEGSHPLGIWEKARDFSVALTSNFGWALHWFAPCMGIADIKRPASLLDSKCGRWLCNSSLFRCFILLQSVTL